MTPVDNPLSLSPTRRRTRRRHADREAEGAADAPTVDEVLSRVTRMKPLLREHSAQGEEDRRLPEESVRALSGAGALQLTMPRRYGGCEAGVRSLLDVYSALAEADGAAAWVTMVLNSGAFSVALFPEEVQDEVFAVEEPARISPVVAATGHGHRESGGWRVSGRWHYASGSWHATWAAVGIPVTDESGELIDQAMVLLPRTDFTVEDTWRVSGLRASGSNCIVADDVFVPERRVGSALARLAGDNVHDHPGGPLYRSSVASLLTLVVVGPLLGLAREALRLVTQKAHGKPVSYTFLANQAESTAFQAELARAATKIDTAHLHAYRSADDIDRAAAAGVPLDPAVRARVRADVGLVAESVLEAVDLLVTAHGAGAFADAGALQRIWRDVHIAARHGALQPGIGYEVLGKTLLGVPQNLSVFV
ncbi:acyl-CoA dehydrogenase family protein [Streptomyces sp. DSM 42041]|uniref:Acyl-CoA dehydrogenase family protein n=1 Tax=Streptomyces hazeniae TaxID=3075538 RepID=A0ABU2NVK8_9ACTN|nr:acyl-CoA dehydrogenase family protein [Streptomyces sp. DSM 42041]MDT0380557.1 acyl-CoA dehydrogenase family protein [Streptomyces sp. DSM 42041]